MLEFIGWLLVEVPLYGIVTLRGMFYMRVRYRSKAARLRALEEKYEGNYANAGGDFMLGCVATVLAAGVLALLVVAVISMVKSIT